METNKDQIEFYLRRHVLDAEDRAFVDQESLARRGVPYGERMAMIERAEEAGKEARALRAALEFIQTNYREGR